MKTIPQNSFLKIYVMSSAGIDLYGIAHVKVDFIPLQKMYIMLEIEELAQMIYLLVDF